MQRLLLLNKNSTNKEEEYATSLIGVSFIHVLIRRCKMLWLCSHNIILIHAVALSGNVSRIEKDSVRSLLD